MANLSIPLKTIDGIKQNFAKFISFLSHLKSFALYEYYIQ